MKRYLVVLMGCSLLGACVYHETDLQLAQEQRDAMLAQKRAQVGCSFIRDHDAYRQCLMNTYAMRNQKGYEIREMTNGQSVAIVGREQGAPSRGCNSCAPVASRCPCNGGCGSSNLNYYQMQAQIAPLPASGPQIIPYTTSESTMVETTCTKDYTTQEASFMTTEVIPQPQPVPVQMQPLPLPPPAPVVEQPKVEPMPDPTWWQSYQANKTVVVPQKPVCPCPDPNDPCPQCFDK